MRRVLVAWLIGALALAASPARADNVSGSVIVPSEGSPAIARIQYVLSGTNCVLNLGGTCTSITGWVITLSEKSGSFTLRRTSGITTLEDFDIFFYSAIDGTGTVVGPAKCVDTGTVCTDTIPSGANYAVVTLSVGVSGSFNYSS